MSDVHVDLDNLKLRAQSFDYIWFTIGDIHGISCGKVVPSRHADLMMDSGVGFYSAVISTGPEGEFTTDKLIENAKHGNMYAVPATNKILALPWAGSGRDRVGEILCDLRWKNGSIVEEYPRYVIKKQLDSLKSMGFTLYAAFEMELSLTKKGIPLHDISQLFSTLRFGETDQYMFDLEKALWQCGVDVECLHVECGPGQMEMAFRPKFGIEAADDMFIFKRAAKEIARKYGMQACFMAKPYEIDSNGAHFNHSLWSTDQQRNMFYAKDEPDNLSQTAKYWIGGIVKHMNAITAICCPNVNCYRHIHKFFSGDKNDWDFDNRSVTLRVKNESERTTYMENRIPTAASNYHLVMAATVAAGIVGIKNKMEPPPNGNRDNSSCLPKTLDEALNALSADAILVEALGKSFIESFICERRSVELPRFGSHDVNTVIEKELEAERKYYFDII